MCYSTVWSKNWKTSERISKTIDHCNDSTRTGQYTQQLLINAGYAMDHLNRTSKATPKVYGKSVIMIT